LALRTEVVARLVNLLDLLINLTDVLATALIAVAAAALL
jgi:hypothetical protein